VKAVVHDRYGGPEVLRVEEVERPVPKDDEILVKVHAATVNRTDCGWRGPHPFFTRFFTGLRRPKQRILGSDFAGEVEAVGAAVTEFAVGDHVFGSTGGFRANAEFVCVRESAKVAHKPAGMTFEEAASICEGAFYALTCLRSTGLRKGQRIVVYGASGAIGTAGVQLAKHFGAHVTAVCDTKTVELVRSLGADEVLDYTREDFTKNGETYYAVFDAVGKHSFRRCRRSLEPGGAYVTTDLGFLWHVPLLILLTRWVGDKKVMLPIAKTTKEDLLFLKKLIEAGEYRAVIDRAYPLEDVVEATRYVETGQKTGNVVLTIPREEVAMLHYDALRQLTHDNRLHHEAECAAERLALQARGRRVRRLPLARELQELRTAHRHAMERTGHIVVTVWPRR
jgi:NADPH:quinone reductase-like Zn-dependent oxidoreductase